MLYLNRPIISKTYQPDTIDFYAGSIFLIDKPQGWTSFDVVNKLRFTLKHGLGVKKIKVGHAGTLDPLATGLLIVCTGKMTKEIDTLQAKFKAYSGSMYVGATTPTYDAESEPDAFFETEHITTDDIQKATKNFIGLVQQIPPVFSAIKMDGTASYKLARMGKEVEMKPRSINIYQFNILNDILEHLDFTVQCSKGTYIRSLVYDFGSALGSGAYMTELRRTAIGDFYVHDAMDIDSAVAYIENKCQ